MALSTNTVWEVRNGGSDTNGGGFVTGASGTDWSLQNAAQYSVTDGVTAGTTTITSASANFGTDVVGNLIYVQGGTGSVVAGWYEITARNSATSITVDRSTGLTAGTGVTLKIGGALATFNKVVTLFQSCHIVFVKYHATKFTTATSLVINGQIGYSGEGPVIVGYDTTRTVTNTDANRPILAASAGSITLLGTTGYNDTMMVRNLIFDGNGQSSVTGFSGGGIYSSLYRCKALALTYGITGAFVAVNCEADTCTIGFYGGWSQGCIAHACTTGFYASSAVNCISYANTTGFDFGASCVNCTAYNNSGVGFQNSGGGGNPSTYVNCIAVLNGSYGFNLAGATYFGSETLVNCATYSNTSGAVNGITNTAARQLNHVTLTGDPFTNAGSGDFSLNSTAGAGAACRATGFPGVFPGGLTTGYVDIGAAQHQDAGGGSTGPVARSVIVGGSVGRSSTF